MILTDAQLKDIIEQFEAALDHRPPAAMCQVSPRALAVALAYFKSMGRAPPTASPGNGGGK